MRPASSVNERPIFSRRTRASSSSLTVTSRSASSFLSAAASVPEAVPRVIAPTAPNTTPSLPTPDRAIRLASVKLALHQRRSSRRQEEEKPRGARNFCWRPKINPRSARAIRAGSSIREFNLFLRVSGAETLDKPFFVAGQFGEGGGKAAHLFAVMARPAVRLRAGLSRRRLERGVPCGRQCERLPLQTHGLRSPALRERLVRLEFGFDLGERLVGFVFEAGFDLGDG